jgi:hypothetical protein
MKLTCLHQNLTEIAMSFRGAGIHCHYFRQVCDRFVWPADIRQCPSEPLIRFREIGRDVQSFAVRCDHLRGLACCLKCVANVHSWQQVRWVFLNRSTVEQNGFIDVTDRG